MHESNSAYEILVHCFCCTRGMFTTNHQRSDPVPEISHLNLKPVLLQVGTVLDRQTPHRYPHFFSIPLFLNFVRFPKMAHTNICGHEMGTNILYTSTLFQDTPWVAPYTFWIGPTPFCLGTQYRYRGYGSM